jgi:hypothetical protein
MAATSAFLLTAAPVHAAAVLLLSDNFNTGNSTDLNIDLATRQAGTLESTGAVAPAGSTWSKISGSTNAILSNQLNVTNGASVSHVVNNADFEAALTSVDLSAVSGFTLSFKMQYTGTAVAWSSPYLSTHFITDERANSRFGLVAFGSGNIQAYGDTPAGLSSDALATALGSWNVNSQNSYSLVATRTTATTGNYDLFINGIEVLSNHNYTFGAGGANGEVNFEIINVNNGAALYDDFSITTIPEPSAALLGGLGLLALLRRRRN